MNLEMLVWGTDQFWAHLENLTARTLALTADDAGSKATALRAEIDELVQCVRARHSVLLEETR